LLNDPPITPVADHPRSEGGADAEEDVVEHLY
jgi:hypothetical protein